MGKTLRLIVLASVLALGGCPNQPNTPEEPPPPPPPTHQNTGGPT